MGLLKGLSGLKIAHVFLQNEVLNNAWKVVSGNLGGLGEVNLLDFLAKHCEKLEGVENEYGHGHDKATGGTLSNENFARL